MSAMQIMMFFVIAPATVAAVIAGVRRDRREDRRERARAYLYNCRRHAAEYDSAAPEGS